MYACTILLDVSSIDLSVVFIIILLWSTGKPREKVLHCVPRHVPAAKVNLSHIDSVGSLLHVPRAARKPISETFCVGKSD